MDKVLINLFVPVLGESFDIFIPQNETIYKTLELIKKAIVQISDGKFIPSRSCSLAYKISGEILDINKSAKEANLHNGSKLMLI